MDYDDVVKRNIFINQPVEIRENFYFASPVETYLVQQVLAPGLTSARVDIQERYGGFFRGLRKSPSREVSVIANLSGRDIRSTTGRNLALLRESSGLDPWMYGSQDYLKYAR